MAPRSPAPSAAAEEDRPGQLARLARLQSLQIIIVLAVIIIIFFMLPKKHDAFLTVFNIRGIVQSTAILAVLAVGMTFVIITGGIDLSIGSVLVFSGVVADKVMANIGGGRAGFRHHRRPGGHRLRARLGAAQRVPGRAG